MFVKAHRDDARKQRDKARRKAKKLGCATCTHNTAPTQPDPDGCELGEFWDEGEDCDLWFWRDEEIE